MTRNDIIRMAREADIIDFRDADDDPHTAQMVEFLERFAALVAAHVRETEFKPDWNNYRQGLADGAAEEREACAKVCDDIDVEYDGEDVLATWCAAAIRARSEV